MPDKIKSIYMRFPEGRTKALTLSYDDGMVLDPKLIEILNKHSLKATFNINSGLFLDDNTPYSGSVYQRMTRNDVLASYLNTPHEIAVHGYSHCDLSTLPPAAIVHEILHDKETLEATFGKIVRGMAYPYGTYNDTVVNVLRSCGIAYARTTRDTNDFDIPTDWLRLPATCHQQSPMLMELAEKFIEYNVQRAPKLFYLWGHSYEFKEMGGFDVIEKFCEYMGGRESEIWYATNIEIYEYIEDYDRLVFSSDTSIVRNPTNRTLYFSIGGGKNLTVIEAGQTLKLK